MTTEERIAYEKWLKDNKVPDYMRRLYNDDPEKIRAAIMKKREKEYEKQAEELAKKKMEKASTNKPEGKQIYSEQAPKKVEKKPAPVKAYNKFIEDDDWESEEPQIYGKREPAKKKTKKYYAEDAEQGQTPLKMSENTKKFFRIGFACLGALLIAVFLLVFITKGKSATKYELAYIQKGTLESGGSGKTYFVRNSITATSGSDGVFVAKIEEGKRIEAGGVIGYVTSSENKNVVEKLNTVKQQIVALQNAEESIVTTRELSEANAKIVDQKNKLEKMASSGNFTDYAKTVDELTALIAERDEVLLSTKSANVNITELQKLKAEYEQIIDKKMQPITAERAGVVSYYISGNEDAENAIYEQIVNQNYTDKFDLLNLFTTKQNENLSGKQVKKNQVVCKVVTDQEYYIIVDNKDGSASDLKGVVTLANGEINYEAAGTVISNDESRAIISSLRDIKSTMPYEQTVSYFSLSSKSGYTVPVTALTDWDKNAKTARLAVVRAKTVKFIYVGVSAFDSKQAVITNAPFSEDPVYDEEGNIISESDDVFRSGDCYVVNAKNVKEGQKID